MVDVSIIVPIFNVEKYLETCLDSMLCINKLNIQIICIDDCSTDNSRDILLKYNRYNNVEIYYNSVNRGLAYTRNVGIEHAIGKYIMFVDSDDYVNAESIEKLIEQMEAYNLDLLYFDVEEFNDGQEKIALRDRRKRKHIYDITTGIELFDELVKNEEMFGCVWNGVYNRAFLEKLSLKFIEGILHEDIPYTFAALMNAERALVVPITGYYYRQRNGSILHQPNYLERIHGLIIGYTNMIFIWHSVQVCKPISNYESSISKYLNSIVSMIESDFQKCRKSIENDAIVKNFMTNFDINKDRELEGVLDISIIKQLTHYNRIAIYGAGNKAKKIVPYLLGKGVPICNIFVTVAKDNKKVLEGINIIEFQKEAGDECEAIIVAVSKPLQQSIVDTLNEKGYGGEIILLPLS